MKDRHDPDMSLSGLPPEDEVEAEIQAMITSDADVPDMDDIRIAEDDGLRAVFPHLAAQQGAQVQGRPPSDAPVAVPVDADIVDRYRAGGDGWQRRLNADLRKMLGPDG
ncbi:BrnA antitoxin family protein [Rhizobium halophytocola]|uniref:Uncharacterized protein (DUF4415 family) n=1 Tax=Rhizobium halophytocola TaxID=735519 RepID=A0ABS4E5M7_9HYPH|nr:BrnA antitoxin family protein [Rhizobium halophytocola]MBP1853223.1 uncharacterized protein (DUF4415 family) [Rhizobium halophytocola]